MLLEAVAVGLRYHFITDDVEHGSSGESRQRRQQCRGYVTEKISGYHTCNFKKGHSERYPYHTPEPHPYHYQRCYYYHPLRDILDGNGYCYGICVCEVVAIEYDTGGESLRKFVNGYRYHKQKHSVNGFVGCGVFFLLFALFDSGNMMKMRSNAVKQCDKSHTECGSDNRLPPSGRTGHFHSRHNQTHQCCRQHHAGAKSEKAVVPFMRYAANHHSRRRPNQRGESESSGTNQKLFKNCHIVII